MPSATPFLPYKMIIILEKNSISCFFGRIYSLEALKPIKSILLFVTIQVTSLSNPDSTCFHGGKVKSEKASRGEQRSGNSYKRESGWVFLYLILA